MRHRDALSEYYNVDALWGYTISAAADIHSRMIRWHHRLEPGGAVVLHRLLVIGAFDWAGANIYQQGNFPSLAFCYACVLGNQLLLRIERSDAMVSVLIRGSEARSNVLPE